jgi:hypothetical protein
MRVIQEWSGNGDPAVAYTRGPDLSGTLDGTEGADRLLARIEWMGNALNSPAFYNSDGVGNPPPWPCPTLATLPSRAATAMNPSIEFTMFGTLNTLADNPNYREALAAAKAGDKAGAENALYELSVDLSIESGSTAPLYIINSQIK